jgi:hypothetical protein
MDTYPLTHENKDQERIIIQEILKNNGYQQKIAHQKQKHKSPSNIPHETQKTK